MSERVPYRLKRLIQQRATDQCEYCLIPRDYAFLPYEPDHIIAVKHGGKTRAENLAWTCRPCNRRKGSDLSSIDPVTSEITPLYNPRSHN